MSSRMLRPEGHQHLCRVARSAFFIAAPAICRRSRPSFQCDARHRGLMKGAVTIEKEGTEIAKVTELGAVFGELSALLNQPYTADVRTLEASEFRVARAELLEEDSVILLYVAAILAQRLNLANQAVIELKSQIQLHHMIRSTIGKAVKKMEEMLSATGGDLVYAPGI